MKLPKPEVSNAKVLVRMAAAGVTPLEHTILSGQYPKAKAPLVLGSEGAGVVEEGGGTEFPVGSRVMFTGPYGASEDGAYSEWLANTKATPLPDTRGYRRREDRGDPGRVSYSTDGPQSRGFFGPAKLCSRRQLEGRLATR